MAERLWLTADEAAEFLGVPRRWLIRESGIQRNQPPGSRQIRYRREVLEKTLKSWDTTERRKTGALRRNARGQFATKDKGRQRRSKKE